MKELIIKTLASVALLGLILVVMKLSVPYHWANEIFSEKATYLKKNPHEFDAYFVGSSHIYNTINPIIFDRITGKDTYNLGSPATFYLETLYLTENFIKEHNLPDGTTFYFRKVKSNNIANENMGTVRSMYYMDWKRLKIGLEYYWPKRNWQQVDNHIKSYFNRLFGVGMLFSIVEYHFESDHKYEGFVVEQKGFLGLDQAIEEKLDVKRVNGLKRRRKRTLQKIENGKFAPKRTKRMYISPVQAKTLKLPDRFIYARISGDPIDSIELYFDHGHYNLAGANEYTRYLGGLVNSGKKSILISEN